MAVYRAMNVVCDSPGCYARCGIEVHGGRAPTYTEVRAEALRKGWAAGRMEGPRNNRRAADYCPEHR